MGSLSEKILKKPEKVEKPLCLRIEDAKLEMIAVANRVMAEYGLPYFIIEPIFKDIYFQIVEGKKAELEAARRDMKKSESEGEVDDES